MVVYMPRSYMRRSWTSGHLTNVATAGSGQMEQFATSSYIMLQMQEANGGKVGAAL